MPTRDARYHKEKGDTKRGRKKLDRHHNLSASQEPLCISYKMELIVPVVEAGGKSDLRRHVNCLGYRRSSLKASFLSFSEIQDASQHLCLVTPHPLPKEVSRQQIWSGGFRKVNGGREWGRSQPPAPALGAGASTMAVTHLPSWCQQQEPCHQLYPGAGRCMVLVLLVLATDSAQVGWTMATTSHSKRAKSLLTGFFPLLYSFGEQYIPQSILGSWVVPWVSSLLVHGI